MKAVIYVEGGGDDSSTLASCREGFRKLLEKSGFEGRMPRIVAKGDRQSAYRAFRLSHKAGEADYVALMVDSEEPIEDLSRPWDHLERRPNDAMRRPEGAEDEQALVIATCMETWIAADRETLARHYSNGCFKERSLPALPLLESQDRRAIFGALIEATRDCPRRYEKGKPSFDLLGSIEPDRIRSICQASGESSASCGRSFNASIRKRGEGRIA